MIPGTLPEPLKIGKTGQRARSYLDKDPSRLLAFEMRWQSSATQEYPSLIDTFFVVHTVNEVFTRDEDRLIYEEMMRLEATGTYIDDEINRLARRGKQRWHIPGVSRVLPARVTACPTIVAGAAGAGMTRRVPTIKRTRMRMAIVSCVIYCGIFVIKYPFSVDEAVDMPCVELLNENHTVIRKYPETFLYLIGLLDFVNSADPFKHNARFLDIFNINSAQHVCMVFELRLRYEHEIMTREKYEKKFTDSVAMVQHRDVKIVNLKAWLEKYEVEAAKVTELCKRVSDLEVMVSVKVGEVATLNTKNAGLLENVYALELVRGKLDGKVAQLTADCDGLRSQVIATELDARIANVRRDMDNELYPYMLTAIAGRRWVVGHGFRLALHKCARSVKCRSALGKVISMAINKEIEGKYVAAVFEFESVSFLLLDKLEGLKDSLIALIMSDCEMLLSDAIPAILKSVGRRGVSLEKSNKN
nr:transposase (putative), gypsy type [Tanacetum cinerariifolium]